MKSRLFQNSIILISCLTIIFGQQTQKSEAASVQIVRDAEIEGVIRDLARPLLAAAGIPNRGIRIILVKNRDFNAFVADPRRIFINIGAVLQTETPNQLSGVLAHEIGHLAGSHLQRLRERIKRARAIAIASALFGVGTSVAGAASGNSAVAGVGQGIVSAGQSTALRDLLSYRRSEELAADRAGLSYLRATKQSAKGMLEVLEKFASQTMFLKSNIDPYAMSHPMPRDRIASTEQLAKQSPYYNKADSEQSQLKYDLIKAKLYAYTSSAKTVLKRYKKSDRSLPATYARAIAQYQISGLKKAIPEIDKLIRSAPRYPHFHHYKGDIMLKASQPQKAITSLRQAVKLDPNSGMFRVTLAQALLALNQDRFLAEAIALLEKGLKSEPNLSIAHRQLAIAYGRKGDIGKAELATARGHLFSGRDDLALHHAKRAIKVLKRGSPSWLRADDIVQSLDG